MKHPYGKTRLSDADILFTPREQKVSVLNAEGKNEWIYETLESYIDECKQIKKQHYGTLDFQWAGGDIKSALELAEKGWPEGLKHMERFTTKITERVKASLPHQEQFYDTSGLDFDMGLVLAGQPESWYDFAPKEEMKFVRIGINGFYSAGASDNVITMRGGAICAIVDALESLNYRVEIDIVQAANDMNQYASKVRVKNFQDALDLDRLAFLATHKAFFRCLNISHAAMKAGVENTYQNNAQHEFTKGFDIYFPAIWTGDSTWQNFESAEKEILRLLEAQGVNLTTKVMGD